MNIANLRTRALLASGVAVLALASSFEVLAQDIDPVIGPVWTAGGHYTAELDMRELQLRLLPLAGLDAKVGLRDICAPGRVIDDGVYILQAEGKSWVLQRTYPNGAEVNLGSERVPLAACEDPMAPRDALKLPQLALLAMEQAAVGAVYVHQ